MMAAISSLPDLLVSCLSLDKTTRENALQFLDSTFTSPNISIELLKIGLQSYDVSTLALLTLKRWVDLHWITAPLKVTTLVRY